MKTNSFTMSEVSSFVTKFSDLLNDGQKASLVMDCDNGEARVTLDVFLQPDRHHRKADYQEHCHPLQHLRHPPHLPGDTAASHPYQPPSGRAGPSRLRRRARRQAAARRAHQYGGAHPPDHHLRPVDRHAGHHPPPPDRRVGHHPRYADRHAGHHPLPPPDRRAGHHPLPAGSRAVHHPLPANSRAVHHPLPAEGHAGHHPLPAERIKCHPPPPPAERRTRHHPHPPPPAETPPQPVAEVVHHPSPLPGVLNDQVSPAPSPSSYSSVVSPKSLARPPDQPGSPGGWGVVDPTRAVSDDEGCDDSEEEDITVHPLHGSPSPDDKQDRADLGSFCFSPLEPPQRPPRDSPPSLNRRLFARKPNKGLSEIRKPVTYLKSLLCLNIERAAQFNNISEDCDDWVWEVCVQKDFETNMTFDHTSCPGFTYKEVQSILQTQAELDAENESDEENEEYEDEKES